MVRGLDLFRARFSAYADQYLLICGTAASLTMEEAGLPFRATKDLDTVLHVEVLTPAYGTASWQFVNAGGDQQQQVSDTGKPKFYRFQKPADERYPAMIELFARAPDGLTPAEGSQLSPIPLDEAVSSLSAILLDETNYAFILAGRRETGGLSWIGEDRLTPLKAIAWLDLQARKDQGATIDGRDIRKHLNDGLRLSQLLAPTTRIPVAPKIGADFARFLSEVAADTSIDPQALQLGKVSVVGLVVRSVQAYGLQAPV